MLFILLCNVAVCLSEIQIIGIQIYWNNNKLSENITVVNLQYSNCGTAVVDSNGQHCAQHIWG